MLLGEYPIWWSEVGCPGGLRIWLNIAVEYCSDLRDLAAVSCRRKEVIVDGEGSAK